MHFPASRVPEKLVRILHLEDDPVDAGLVHTVLQTEGINCQIERVESGEDFERQLQTGGYDLVLTDYALPSFNGASALAMSQQVNPELPVIFISGTMGEEVAVECLRCGAVDYVVKDQLQRLPPAVRRALREAHEKTTRQRIEEELRQRNELFRQITENVDDLITVLDRRGRHLFCSPSFRKLALEPEELIGTDAFARVHPDDRERVQTQFAALVQTGESQRSDFRFFLPDGRIRHLENRGSVIRDRHGLVQSIIVVARDVTEHHTVNERLRLLEAAVQNSDEAMVITDAYLAGPGPETLFVNAAFCTMTGCKPEEILGRPPRPADSSTAPIDPLANIRKRLEWGGPLYGEELCRRRDGAEYWIEWYSVPLRNEQRQVTHYVIVQRDVTLRKRTEAQIREQAALLDQAHDAICVMDMEQRIRYWNHGSERLFGWQAEAVLGSSAVDLLFHGDQKSLAAALKGLISRGEWRGELSHVTQAGSQVFVESRWSLLRDEQARPKTILLINTDITERKLAERKVREQAALLDQAQDAIFVCDLERRITYWNKGAERMYGWPSEAVLGLRASDLLYRQGLAERQETWTTALETGEWSGEIAQARNDGRELIVASRLTVLRDAQERPVAILNLNSDITQRKQLEAQFLRSQRLENIGALAGGIAHDLNNILSPILMVADVLREELSSDESRQMMDTVKSSAERGADLVRQILSFARGVGNEPAIFDLRHVVKDVIKMARSTFHPSIQLETHLADNLRSIRGDPTRLHQVLLNLCVNARDAMPAGGTLRIEARNVTLAERVVPGQNTTAEGLYVQLGVTDTGTGIPPHLQEKIFLPFFTTKGIGQGTGLGLSTVANIVRDHGGFVEVRSQIGEGSSFQVFLPATLQSEQVPATTQPAEPPLGHGERILLVDDDRAVLEMTRQALKAYHYEVLLAKNGAEALEAYHSRTQPIDLVITDLQMPIMDGPSFVREMRRLDPRLKIICVSGLASESKLAELDRSKVAVLLGKPFTAERLLTTVRTVLAS